MKLQIKKYAWIGVQPQDASLVLFDARGKGMYRLEVYSKMYFVIRGYLNPKILKVNFNS